jgi:PleD family two-component response regulator
VLIADQDSALLRQLTEAINRNGFCAVPVCDGREALGILHRESDFMAAMFAVAMSHIQGPDLLRYMKSEKRLKHIPIIMMSSQQNPTLSADAFSAGAQVFPLPKPFTPPNCSQCRKCLLGRIRDESAGSYFAPRVEFIGARCLPKH